jgi:heat shock protein HtpX
MEMCLDNPREGFGELFETHPTVDSRVAALVKFAGGHDPGPRALPPGSEAPAESPDGSAAAGPWDSPPADGPWGSSAANGANEASPAEIDGRAESPGGPPSGPWGPHKS